MSRRMRRMRSWHSSERMAMPTSSSCRRLEPLPLISCCTSSSVMRIVAMWLRISWHTWFTESSRRRISACMNCCCASNCSSCCSMFTMREDCRLICRTSRVRSSTQSDTTLAMFSMICTFSGGGRGRCTWSSTQRPPITWPSTTIGTPK